MTKLIRIFFKLVLSGKRIESEMIRYRPNMLSLRINNSYFGNLISLRRDFEIFVGYPNNSIVILKDSTEQFLELEDVEIILKYGRNILDENIFKKFKNDYKLLDYDLTVDEIISIINQNLGEL